MKQISIKIKFGVLVGILIFIVVIAISTTLLNQEKKVLVERIQRQGLILSKNLASSAAEGITTSDELVIYQTIEDIIRQEEKEAIKEAFVLDTTGKIIAHNNIKKVGQSLDTRSWESDIKKESQKPRLFEKDNELLYDFMTPIFLKTFKKGVLKRVLIGSAHIIYSYRVVQKALNKATLSVFFISFLILAAGIGASFLLTRFIVSPIMKIAHGAQQIGNGNLQYKISVNTKDELEFLSNQFNIMTEKLEEAQKIMLKQERLKYELDIATGIQNSLIPQKIPSIKNMALSAYYSPAKEIGGDYYDFYKIDNNKLGIIMADVSGKGVPAAMIMVMVRSILKSQVFSAKTAFHT
ncbi:MAG: HAMP domain-containing protein, partial [Spirochaetes bacterium]|nr:HAMP domain-containing protein [Spirochaetota bacterium]